MKVKSKIRPYARILKEDYDWDWYYALPLLRKKLERMANYFDKSRLIEGWQDDVNEIRLCIRLIDIVSRDDQIYDIMTNTISKYVNIRNSKRFNIDKSYFNRDSITVNIFKEELRIEKAWHLLWRLIELKMRNWWD